MQNKVPVFRAEYTTNASDIRYRCNIMLEPDRIHIQYYDELQQLQNVYWELNHISSARLGGKQIQLKYNNFLDARLQINDPLFPKTISQTYFNYYFATECYKPFFSKGMKKALGILGGFILLIALTYFIILPKAAEYVAGVIPVSVEESIGESVYNDFTRYSTKNVEKTDLVNAFFQEMNLDMQYDYRITVVNKDEVNAFALPAGRIVVYSEILDRMNSYEELAAVLAHEYAHVELRHSLKSIFRSLSGSIMLAVIFGGVDGGSIIQNAHVFSDLQYSRKAEREADLYGLDALVKSGIDPQGMVKLFKTLGSDDENTKALAVSEFMSTHPLFDSRIKYIEEYMESGRGAQKQYSKNETLESLWQQIKKPGVKKVWK